MLSKISLVRITNTKPVHYCDDMPYNLLKLSALIILSASEVLINVNVSSMAHCKGVQFFPRGIASCLKKNLNASRPSEHPHVVVDDSHIQRIVLATEGTP